MEETSCFLHHFVFRCPRFVQDMDREMPSPELMSPDVPFSDAKIAAIFEEVLQSREAGPEEQGHKIGVYELVEILGEGGFGVVWKARQTTPFEREVALKIMKPGIDSEEVLARFQREQQLLARLDHPGIAAVYDAGLTQQDRPYIVMEQVCGIPLHLYCAQNALSLQAKIALMVDLCAALQHAHEKGVIHRDLKPSNVLITELDGVPKPKIIDFGIAKALSHDGYPQMTWMTRQTRLLGTPAYMSPEQVKAGMATDIRADIYSVGVLLYELVAGRVPFQQQLPLTELMRVIQEQDPRPPLTHRSDLNWIILRCLEKNPERRYPSAEALEEELKRWQNGQPVTAHPPTRRYLMSRWLKRNRSLAASLALVVLSLPVAAGLAVGQMLRAEERQRESEAVEEALVTSMHRAIATRLGHAPRAYDLVKDVLLQIKAGDFPGSPETLKKILLQGSVAAANARDQALADWCLERLHELERKAMR